MAENVLSYFPSLQRGLDGSEAVGANKGTNAATGMQNGRVENAAVGQEEVRSLLKEERKWVQLMNQK